MEDKNVNDSNKNVEMSSSEMFNSWTQQLMEGTQNSESANSSQQAERKVEANPFEDLTIKHPVVDNVKQANESSNLNQNIIISHEEKEPNMDIPNVMENISFNTAKDNSDVSYSEESESRQKEAAENKTVLISVLMIIIIFCGFGFMIFNTIQKKKELEENPIKNVLEDEHKELDNEIENESKSIEMEEIPKNEVHQEELKRLCQSIDNNGNYYAEMNGNINDVNYVIENAKYCNNFSCMYTENDMVYTRNCKTSLENSSTVTDTKISTAVGAACVEYNKNGTYSNPEFGIECSNGRCSTVNNGRNYNQNCSKFDKIS